MAFALVNERLRSCAGERRTACSAAFGRQFEQAAEHYRHHMNVRDTFLSDELKNLLCVETRLQD